MADNQSTDAVPICPKCGQPCTFETTIGIRYCANAHAWKGPDYPHVEIPTGRARQDTE